MKKLILGIVASTFISLSACAQKEAPAAVKTAFTQKFAKATDVEWGKENKTEWEAEFKLSGKSYSAIFDLQGNWMETEQPVSQSEIPANIKSQIENNYSGYKVKESEISETAKGQVYEFEIVKGGTLKEISFNLDGKQIK